MARPGPAGQWPSGLRLRVAEAGLPGPSRGLWGAADLTKPVGARALLVPRICPAALTRRSVPLSAQAATLPASGGSARVTATVALVPVLALNLKLDGTRMPVASLPSCALAAEPASSELRVGPLGAFCHCHSATAAVRDPFF